MSESQQNLSNLTQENALKILINSVTVAQKRGCFNLEEAAVVHQAVSAFVKKEEAAEENSAAAVSGAV